MYDAKKIENKDKDINTYSKCVSVSDRSYFAPHITEQLYHTKIAYIPKENMFF